MRNIFFFIFSAYAMAQTQHDKLQNNNLQKILVNIDNRSFTAYGHLGDKTLPLLVMVHGSPGDYSAWRKYLDDSALLKKYRMIAIDRPGFGASDSTKAYPSMVFQAKVVHQFILQYAENQPVILLGHSVGGPVIARCAMDYPDAAQHIVLLAPAISAKHEQPRWYNWLVKNKWIRSKIPQEMRISQDEMMQLPAELEAMEPLFSQIKAQVWLLHGRLDMIAPFGNSRFLKKKIPAAQLHFTIFNWQNHFIPWTKFEEIRALLLGIA
jgi:pimeloyl-ACP methyl ester carboxylesterase